MAMPYKFMTAGGSEVLPTNAGPYAGTTGQGEFLPLDPAEWTTQQRTEAATMMLAYGEAIAAGQTYEPRVAQTSALYSYVTTGTAIAHVKAGN